VYDQGREISRMATLLKLLGDRLKNLDAGSGQPMAASERPPHY